MPYEISIYKAKLKGYFKKFIKKFKENPLREDAYERAARISVMLKEFTEIEDDSFVPSDSVIREFIGGSSLAYH